MEIECQSAVSKVVVHARGALVTREVTLPPDLPRGVVDVVLPGITLAAQPGSARAALEDSARLVALVRSSVVVPGRAVKAGPTVTKVRELTARKQRLDEEHAALSARRVQLAECTPSPALRVHDARKRERDALDVRFGEALAMARLLAAKIADLDERVFAIEREQRDLAVALEAARLDDAQTSSLARQGEGHPTRRIVVRTSGEGAPGKLLVTYAVAAARWWPAYTLRIEEGGARATWTFDAHVAQRTGEDWSAALLALSSADLVFDARLPELPSLRFGRAQAPRRRPLRPAPAGVDEMFAPYLAFRSPPAPPPPPPPAVTVTRATATAVDDDEASDGAYGGAKDAYQPAPAMPGAAPKLEAPRQASAEMARFAAMPAPMIPPPQGAPLRGRGGPPPAAMMAAPVLARSASALDLLGGAFGGGEGGELGASAREEAAEPELVLGDRWSDLDALVLARADEPRRGKLVPQPATADAGVDRAVAMLAGVAKARWLDPLEARGMFDHRYEAAGRADVPSDGRAHRVGVGTRACDVVMSWRTVPSEAAEVYREANVTNPFDQALLGGPVDVYLDGSLLAETSSTRIDRGGTLWCGMGVDDRVKVARNVRAEEESAGLLGGSLAVTHAVSIELTSTIRDPIKVVALERVPVTDDKAIEIKLVKAKPSPAAYDQAERGAPIRGGFSFDAVVTAGKPTTLELVYRLVFASKLDIVGGSRRG